MRSIKAIGWAVTDAGQAAERSGSLQEFVYERPGTVEEAVAAMRAGDARALAGGTDLVPQLREGRRRAGRVVDLKHVPERDGDRGVARRRRVDRRGGDRDGGGAACGGGRRATRPLPSPRS